MILKAKAAKGPLGSGWISTTSPSGVVPLMGGMSKGEGR